MRHGTVSRRLGVKTPHRNSLLRNLSLGVIEHGRIKTTTNRAKTLRGFLEPLVTRLKDPTVANIRYVKGELANVDATMKLMKVISPAFMSRPGGYLRILKMASPRVGDNADMSIIEWVEEKLVRAYQPKEVAPKDAKGKKAAKAGAKKTASKKKADDGEKAEKVEKTEKPVKATAAKKTLAKRKPK